MPSASSYLNPKHLPVAACGPGEASGLSRLWGKLGGAEERVKVTCHLTFIQWRLGLGWCYAFSARCIRLELKEACRLRLERNQLG